MKNLKRSLNQSIEDNINIKKKLQLFDKEIFRAIKFIFKSLNNGGKIMLCGNGGSAADAQHLAAEFLVRLRPNINRQPIAAITLAQDSSTLTACGNDYSFEDIYSRNLEALGKKNDILICISTSGKSKNILKAIKSAKKMGIKSIGFFSELKNRKKLTDIELIVPSKIVARIQEAHIFLGHFIFEQVENLVINRKNR
jgi:D-sedoheptulose 7-phosphate isomerase